MKNLRNILFTILLATLVISLTACGEAKDVSTTGKNAEREVPVQDENVVEEPPISGNIENSTNSEETSKKQQLEELDRIQAELDALPEKKDADKGITNAMRSYYGVSYERYDKKLNEIYSIIKETYPPEKMEELKSQQLEWIQQKEKNANEEAEQFKGGTFEEVARYISLYESTKKRCYKLVNTYLEDK